jgi:hypothetical protein
MKKKQSKDSLHCNRYQDLSVPVSLEGKHFSIENSEWNGNFLPSDDFLES